MAGGGGAGAWRRRSARGDGRQRVAQGRGDVGRHGATADNGRAVLDDEINARTTWSAAHELEGDVLAARRALAAVAGSRTFSREGRDAAIAGGGGAGAWRRRSARGDGRQRPRGARRRDRRSYDVAGGARAQGQRARGSARASSRRCVENSRERRSRDAAMASGGGARA